MTMQEVLSKCLLAGALAAGVACGVCALALTQTWLIIPAGLLLASLMIGGVIKP